jgi:hypothetical protein
VAVRKQILDKLKEGASLKEIRSDHGGGSLYRALRDYFDWVEEKIEEYQKTVAENQKKKMDLARAHVHWKCVVYCVGV